MEILITHCLWGESSMQPQLCGLENDLMETMSHIKSGILISFTEKKDEWVQVQALN